MLERKKVEQIIKVALYAIYKCIHENKMNRHEIKIKITND